MKPENTKLSVDTLNTSAVLLGSTIVFNCSTWSFPPAHDFLFYHNQLYIGSNASSFYYLQISESGTYSCSPINNAGFGESATVSLTVVGRCITESLKKPQRCKGLIFMNRQGVSQISDFLSALTISQALDLWGIAWFLKGLYTVDSCRSMYLV